MSNLSTCDRLPVLLERSIVAEQPVLWLNSNWSSRWGYASASDLDVDDVLGASRNVGRFGPLLMTLFPELTSSGGIVESPLYDADALKWAMASPTARPGRWLIKGDHALPIAGSIKARGGIYEVLLHAEALARREGVMNDNDDPVLLTSARAKDLFLRHQVVVGSTGNLGLSIGVMAAALGFQAVVHMSADAKEWKKVRLKARGVHVIEHTGDYCAAVAAGRREAEQNPCAYFVDDENSIRLFLGYSIAAIRLQHQLAAASIRVDEAHPLFVYLPCGVGGAPGGITFGLRHLFGDYVHCFFAEPVAAPCMLVRLAALLDRPLSVKDVGLRGRTEADGLAVGQASELVARLVRRLVSGVFTVLDDELFEDLYQLERTTGLQIEPSAAAGFRGPKWVLGSDAGRQYLAAHGLLGRLETATHILWTTGGGLLPNEEYRRFYERGRELYAARTM